MHLHASALCKRQPLVALGRTRSISHLFLACQIIICGTTGCHRPTDAKSNDSVALQAPAPLRTKLLTVAQSTWPYTVRTQGSLAADEVTVVGAKVAGRVVAVQVDLGDSVQAGDILLTLDRDEFQLAVEQATAQLAQARAAVGLTPDDDVSRLDPANAPPVREARAVWEEARQRVERLRQLREEYAVSLAEMEQSEADERVAEARLSSALNSVREKIAQISVQAAELSLAEQRLNEAQTPAPFAGFVRQRFVAPGTYVQVGQPLVELVRTSVLRFRGAVPERYAAALRLGQQVSLNIEALATPVQVAITRISPALDELSRSLLFEAEIQNPDGRLRAGLFVEAEVILEPEAQAIVLPATAVTRFAGVDKVWKVVDGKAMESVVRLGRETEGRVEIVDGLLVNDVIVADASQGRVAPVEGTP